MAIQVSRPSILHVRRSEGIEQGSGGYEALGKNIKLWIDQREPLQVSEYREQQTGLRSWRVQLANVNINILTISRNARAVTIEIFQRQNERTNEQEITTARVSCFLGFDGRSIISEFDELYHHDSLL